MIHYNVLLKLPDVVQSVNSDQTRLKLYRQVFLQLTHKAVNISNTALVSSFYDLSGRHLMDYTFSGQTVYNVTSLANGCYPPQKS